ncbi:MAG: hypothetical protein KAI79_12040 [Bacteroidales bacterium]|nr:hypothetical protein [Bacteroidales bacterium]
MDKVKQKMGKMDELKNVAPELSKLKKENPFGTPDNYFDNFSSRLQLKLKEEKRIVPKQQNKIIRILKPALGVAASLALIFMLAYWPVKTFMPNQIASNTEIFDVSEIDYLSIVEGIDENSFYTLLDEPDNSIEFSDEDLLSYVNTNVSEYEIYLATNY